MSDAHGLTGPAMPGPFPKGPWVIVAGMHRSGTSAITGALGELGMSLPRPEDRIESSLSNPDHWESNSIMLHNDEVLDRLGGSWSAPPDLQPDWVHEPQLAGLADPAPLFSRTFPEPGPLVWKDPRLCLLLPYWRPRIPEPVAAVFIWRSPIAVAHSLQNRDGFTLVHGLALWERYNRAALEGLRGMDVFVFAYEALMQDHRGTVGSIAEWLGSLDQFAARAEQWDVDKAASLVSDELVHQSIDAGSEGLLLSEHHSMTQLLSDLEGGHRPFDPGPLLDESGWIMDVLADRREARLAIKREGECWERVADRVRRVSLLEAEVGALTDSLHSVQEGLDFVQAQLGHRQAELEQTQTLLGQTQTELGQARRELANLRASTSWRVTKPIRSVSAKVQGRTRASRGTPN